MGVTLATRLLLPYLVYGICIIAGVSSLLGYYGAQDSLVLALVGYVAVAVALHLADARVGGRAWSPHSVVFGFWEGYFALGVVVFVVRARVFFNYPADIWTAFWAGCLMTLALWSGRWLGSVVLGSVRRPRGNWLEQQSWVLAHRLQLAALGFIAVAYAGAALMYLPVGFLSLIHI